MNKTITNQVLQGDCLEHLRSLPDNSIDSCVTDPPYGISFMNKKWDYDIPAVEVWKEVLRVLKPGGHALVACGTRTQHRMAVNIEDAGFQIRDIICWHYGSGFPKSLNIGKAIDKQAGVEREVVGKIKSPYTSKDTSLNTSMHNTTDDDGYRYTVITTPATPEAKKWEGWGTGLKPSTEFWTLARKPISESTIAENVLRWNTGGINIDACRVGTEDKVQFSYERQKGNEWNEKYGNLDVKYNLNTLGRFPANLILDDSDEVRDLFPKTKGGKQRDEMVFNDKIRENAMQFSTEKHQFSLGDSGSAARFFYCAKASKSERNAGLEGFEEKPKLFLNNKNNSTAKNGVAKNLPRANFHPTVKPLSLMRYLIRLITPKGGIVLDPYGGSGSTGVAAKQLGFNSILLEREPDYVKIAEARIAVTESIQ